MKMFEVHLLIPYSHLSLTVTYPSQLLIPYSYLSFTVTYPLQLLIPYSCLSLTVPYPYLSPTVPYPLQLYTYPLLFPWRALLRNPEVRSETSLDNEIENDIASRHVLCPPNHAAHVLRIKYRSREVETIGPDLRFPGGGGYVACATALDGQVYCPAFSAPRTLRIDGDCQVELFGPELPFMAHQWGTAMLASDGCIYALPCNAGRQRFFYKEFPCVQK